MTLPERMRAALLRAPGVVELVELPTPRPGPGEAVVRIRACGICGSDLMDWYVAAKAPFVFGHEPAGEIVAVGPGVAGFRPGDRVFVHHHAPCGECDACRRGDDVHCRTWRESRLDPGGMAEYARVPAVNLARDTLLLPDGVDFAAATLVEPAACAVKALRRAAGVLRGLAGARGPGAGGPGAGGPAATAGGERPLAGLTVLVIGLGFMGQVLGTLARVYGAAGVYGSDPVAARRECSREWADAVFDPAEGPAGAAVREAVPGGVDLAVVTPPLAAAIRDGFAAARSGGAVLLYAPTPPGEGVPLDLHDAFFREVTLLTSYSAGPWDTREALRLLEDGHLRAERLISHRFPLERAAEAYRAVKDAERVLKVIVEIGTGADGLV